LGFSIHRDDVDRRRNGRRREQRLRGDENRQRASGAPVSSAPAPGNAYLLRGFIGVFSPPALTTSVVRSRNRV
jgi:hypothetical protein